MGSNCAVLLQGRIYQASSVAEVWLPSQQTIGAGVTRYGSRKNGYLSIGSIEWIQPGPVAVRKVTLGSASPSMSYSAKNAVGSGSWVDSFERAFNWIASRAATAGSVNGFWRTSQIVNLSVSGVSVASATGGAGTYVVSRSGSKVEVLPITATRPTAFVDIVFSGIADTEALSVSESGGVDDGSLYEIISPTTVRVYQRKIDNSVYGDCSLTVGKRFTGAIVRVTPNLSDPSLPVDVAEMGDFTVTATSATGAAITPQTSIDSETGVISVELPDGASCSVTYTIRGEYAALWSVNGAASAVVASVTNVQGGSGTPIDYSFNLVRKNLYFVLPSDQSSAFAVTSPATPDIIEDGVAKYVEGRSITVTAQLEAEQMLTAVYLDDENHTNFATYTGDSIRGASIVIQGISRSCYVRGTFAAKQYRVTCAADEPSDGAFSAISVEAGGESVEFVEKGTAVTFSATPASGYAFEGFYLGGEPKEGAVVDPVTGAATLTIEIEGETSITVKAKVAVSLNVNGSGNLLVDGAVVTTPYSRNVTLGESFQYSTQPVGENVYFLLWYETDMQTPVYGYGASGTIAPTAPIEMVAKFGEVDPTQGVSVSAGYVERNRGSEGTIFIDGEETMQVVRLAGDTVVLSVKPRNGWMFGGWFDNPAGQGNPVSKDAEISFLAYVHPELFALFEVNTHAICEWEGTAEPKDLVWRSKTYAASKPFNPSACRVDALGYPPGTVPGMEIQKVLELTVDMFSAPDVNAKPTASTTLTNIADQDARRLPVRRMERYMQVQIKANAEIDALLVGTSMEGLAI